MYTNTSAIEKNIFAENILKGIESTSLILLEETAFADPHTMYQNKISKLISNEAANVFGWPNINLYSIPNICEAFESEYITSTDSIPTIISDNWNQIYNSGLSENVYLELLNLAAKKDGWRGDGSKSLSSESFSTFLEFWNKIKNFSSNPEFTLTPLGNPQAEWFKNNNHYVEIEFLPKKRTIFGIFDGKTVIEGEGSITDLYELLTSSNKAKNRLTWFYDG